MNDTPPSPPAHPARHLGLDALRGALLAAVIIGHFPVSALGHRPFGALGDWLYFFHMPLFLALSCLFVPPVSFAWLGRRAWRILVPYALAVAASHPWRLLVRPGGLAWDAFLGNWAHLLSVLWFLPALFSVNLLTAMWRRAGDALRVALLLPALGAFRWAPELARLHPRVPFGLDVALYLLPFVLVVDLAWRRRESLARRAGPWLAPLALAAAVLGALAIRFCEPVKTHSAFARRVDFAQFSVAETLPGYLGLLLLGAGLALLAARLRGPRWLAAVGRHSMPVFLLHYPLLWALRDTLSLAGETPAALLLVGCAVVVAVAGLALLAARILAALWPGLARVGLGDAPWGGRARSV